ncbi:conjugal transfer protein [Sinomonas sp. JGH33]|uniref:Conjugal transfer protein n=1 Tax=Sinomonas terricola TaxID=3110330 RepID=A0ABU5TAU5_9MICC|nr:conjugal transfer protein [Sinomonas sp. JGH33]MEA5456812.1 conjugal transfer protein [Sinomonas sp. JGH33]
MPQTHHSTAASALKGRAAVVGVWALIVLWPVLAARAFVPAPAHVAQEAKPVEQPESRQRAGAIAEAYVSAWLRATRTSSDDLARFGDIGGLVLPDRPTEARDLGIASSVSNGAASTVTVSAAVHEVSASPDGKASDGWPMRFFQVDVVEKQGGALAPLGLPRAVAAPAAKTEPIPGYGSTLSTTHPAAQAAQAFIAAYCCGAGDASRYTSPGSGITAISPAPYRDAKPISVAAQDTPAEVPQDGAQALLLLRVQLSTADGRMATADYTLKMLGRAGRWEVAQLNPPPRSTSTARTTQ